MGDIEPSRDADLQQKYAAWIELVEGLLGPVGVLSKFVRTQMLNTLSAAEQHGATIAELAAAINERPALGALVVNALESARRTRLEVKTRAFGRAIALGYAATDDAEIDMQQIVVRTIDALEMPHISALLRLRDASGSVLDNTSPEQFARRTVEQSVGFNKTPARPVFETLNREGLLDDTVDRTATGQHLFRLSIYGRHMLDYLRERASQQPPTTET